MPSQVDPLFAALREIGGQIAAASTAQTVWTTVLREVARVLAATRAAWIWESPVSDIQIVLDQLFQGQPGEWQTIVMRVNESHLTSEITTQETDQRSSLIVVPVMAGEWCGKMVLLREKEPFSETDLQFAGCVSEAARQNVLGRLHTEQSQAEHPNRIRSLEMVQQVGRLITSNLDLDATLLAVLESLRQLVPYSVGEITLFDPQRNVLVRRAVFGDAVASSWVGEGGHVYHPNEGLSGWLSQHRQALLVDDLLQIHDLHHVKVDDTLQLRSYLGIPLLARGELVGTLEIATLQPGQLTQWDRDVAEMLGQQAVIAIENAQLYQAVQQRVQMLERLREVGRAVARAGDPTTFFAEAARGVADLVNASMAGILLYDAQREVLQAQLPFVGLSEELTQTYEVPFVKGGELERHWREHFYWLIEDAQSHPLTEKVGLRSLAMAADAHQVLFMPLESGDELLGFIQAANPLEGHRFTADDAQLLAMFASQISGTVRISDLVKRMETRTQHLTSLVSVAAVLGKSLDMRTVLDEIARAVTHVLHCDRTVIFVLDPATNLLSMEAALGVSERYKSLSQGIPVLLGGRGHAVAANEMYFSCDVRQDPESAKIAPLATQEGFRAFADIPLHRGDKAVGLLSVQFTQPHFFTDDELMILQILAEQAAVAVENARLYTRTDVELQRRLVALESLQHVTREIIATVDLNHILQVVLKEVLEFAEADAGLIAILGGEQQIEFPVAQGYSEEVLRKLHSADLQHLFTEFTRPELLYIPDTQESTRPFPPAARALLLAPVLYEGRLAAIIMIQSARPHAFPEAVNEFLEGLAAQTSIAIGNARLYQDQVTRGELAHRRAEQMSLLLEVSRTMRSDRPLREVLLDVAYAVQEGIGFNIVLISVLQDGMLHRIAGAGIPLADLERMRKSPQSWSRVQILFREEFSLGRCYYVPAEHFNLLNDLDVFVVDGESVRRKPGQWHKLDSFIVPLRGSRGDIVGMMSVDDPRDGRVPTHSTAEVIEIFAAHVALAIENSRLVDDLQRRISTLQLFNELNRSITTKLDLPVVLNTVAQSVTNVLGYDYATIFLRDQSGQYFVPMVSSGYALELLASLSFGAGDGPVGNVAQTGMPLVLEDTTADSRFLVGPVVIGSSIMVPMMVEGRSVGVLTADRKVRGSFSPTDVATLTALADQVSVAVENARLFEEVTRFSRELEQRVEERTQELAEASESLRLQRDRTEVLYRIASELVASLDFDRVLSQALLLLQRTVKASRGAVILLDNNTGKLMYRAVIGHTAPIPPGGSPAPYAPHEGIIGWVISNRQPLVIADVRKDPRWVPDNEDARVRAMLAVPILGGAGEALGMISLQSMLVGVFHENDVRLVEAAAVQLGNALNNSELYRLIREQAERLGAMLRAQQIEAAKNQAILEGIADGVIVADANGRVILFNAAAERIFSITRGQALGRFLDEILGLYGTEARDWMSRIEDWKRNLDAYGVDQFLNHRLEIERRTVSVHISPVVSPTREFLGVVSVFRDITAEVEADRAKSEFVSTVSHELRTPMTSIKGYVDLLLMGSTGELSEMQRAFLGTVKTNADRLTGLVNDLLDISRIETGRVELSRKPVQIGNIVEQVIDMLRPKAAEKDLQLYKMLPTNLPLVYGDEARLTQILTNLVGNAYKYTPAGGLVGVYAYVRKEMMHIAVSDTGIGIGPENQKKIFERFFRVDDPAVMEVSGTGLGLSITVSLIQMHGGDIWLESELGEGSIFTFTLPLAEGESLADAGEPPAGFDQTPTPRVLVVENDEAISERLRRLLDGAGIQVLIAQSGEDALRVVRRELPHLISLNANLPDLEGLEVLQLLRRDAETADIPVILVTRASDHKRGMASGAAGCLTKPLQDATYLEEVRQVLSRYCEPVLVVEDDREWVVALREELAAQGIGIRVASSGKRVLRLARELRPTVILLNTQLADMEVPQLLERLRRNPRTADVLVILLASQAAETQMRENSGSVRCLLKPVNAKILAQEIASQIKDAA